MRTQVLYQHFVLEEGDTTQALPCQAESKCSFPFPWQRRALSKQHETQHQAYIKRL